MYKIMITKKKGNYLKEYYNEISYDLAEGYTMYIERIRPIKNKFGLIKYYKVYIRADYSTQKDVVEVFKRLGLIHKK